MGPVTKTVRLSGSAEDSVEDAIAAVLGRAAQTIEDIVEYEVVRIGGTVDASGAPAGYAVTLDITFAVKETGIEHG